MKDWRGIEIKVDDDVVWINELDNGEYGFCAGSVIKIRNGKIWVSTDDSIFVTNDSASVVVVKGKFSQIDP